MYGNFTTADNEILRLHVVVRVLLEKKGEVINKNLLYTQLNLNDQLNKVELPFYYGFVHFYQINL